MITIVVKSLSLTIEVNLSRVYQRGEFLVTIRMLWLVGQVLSKHNTRNLVKLSELWLKSKGYIWHKVCPLYPCVFYLFLEILLYCNKKFPRKYKVFNPEKRKST